MDVVILGMGYVGLTVAACLLDRGHLVIGVDPVERKVRLVRDGVSPLNEPGVGDLLAAGRSANRLFADTTPIPYLLTADMVQICVGTPSGSEGDLDHAQVEEAAREIGQAIRTRSYGLKPLLCVFRSTVSPGTMDRVIIPLLTEAAGEPPGPRYEVVFNPEFFREGRAIRDYTNPPKIVIGERERGVTRRLAGTYDGINAPFFEVSFAEAEFVKFADNSFHALKVAFANEIGRLCAEAAVDPQRVMDLFVADTTLNLSSYYLRPGGAFGGSCLPKDLRALLSFSRRVRLRIPVLEAVLPSNEVHKEYLVRTVAAWAPPGARILQLGLTFKADSDDLRESPLVHLARRLIREGYELSIYEPDLSAEAFFARHTEGELSNLAGRLVTDLNQVRDPALIVIGKGINGDILSAYPGVPTIDLHRLNGGLAHPPVAHAVPYPLGRTA